MPAAPSVLSYWTGAGEEQRKCWKVAVPPSVSSHPPPAPPPTPPPSCASSAASSKALQTSRGSPAGLPDFSVSECGRRPHLVSISKHKQLPGAGGWTDLVTKCSKSIIASSFFQICAISLPRVPIFLYGETEIMDMGVRTACWLASKGISHKVENWTRQGPLLSPSLPWSFPSHMHGSSPGQVLTPSPWRSAVHPPLHWSPYCSICPLLAEQLSLAGFSLVHRGGMKMMVFHRIYPTFATTVLPY